MWYEKNVTQYTFRRWSSSGSLQDKVEEKIKELRLENGKAFVRIKVSANKGYVRKSIIFLRVLYR